MWTMRALGMFLAVGLVLGGAASAAYEVIEVTAAGTLKGTVKLIGSSPEDPTLKIDNDVDHCGTIQPSGMYKIGAKGGVQNALVYVNDITGGKAAPAKHKTEIDNVSCAFEPLVGIAYVGGSFVITNSDPIFHNTHLYLRVGERERTIYNLGLPKQGMTVRKPVKKPGMVKITCDVHSWMRAYLYVSEHPYVAVTDESGSFEIGDLPAGKYTLTVWHEGLGEQTLPIEVATGAASSILVEYTSEK